MTELQYLSESSLYLDPEHLAPDKLFAPTKCAIRWSDVAGVAFIHAFSANETFSTSASTFDQPYRLCIQFAKKSSVIVILDA